MDEKTEGTIGARVRELRKYKKLNQTEFGAIIGLSQRAIATIETGEKITERNFNAICKELSVNPEWLRTGEGEMFIEPREVTREALIKSVAVEFALTADETALLRTFLDLEKEHRDSVMTFFTNFAKTMAAQMGIEFTAESAEKSKPEADMTKEERLELVQYQLEKQEEARKRGTSTSSASTGTNGRYLKNSINTS